MLALKRAETYIKADPLLEILATLLLEIIVTQIETSAASPQGLTLSNGGQL